MTTEVRVPTLGESVTEATVATWFKQPGDAVAADEILCELETDKVSVEVPAPAAGRLAEHVAKEGETVGVNALLATIEAGEGAAPKKDDAPKADAPEADAPKSQPAPAKGRTDVEDAPSARVAMAEAGLSRDQVQGSGRDGRVMKEDVLKAVASIGQSAAPAPAAARAPVAVADAEREKRVKMTRLRQTIARRLKDAQNTAAMLTTYNEVDMSGIMG
ncbi:MAG: biotin/lipoyl-containing protein, partial [Rubrimonas sp.]